MTDPLKQGLFKYDIIDHHAILGLPLGASTEAVRERFLQIAYRLHPDTCKLEGETAKEQATQLFSKWVNPAYENLAKTRSRNDYLLVLSHMGQKLSRETQSIVLSSKRANQFMQETGNCDLVYRKLLRSSISGQYEKLDEVFEKIGKISELNLVYLVKTQGQSIQEKKQAATRTSPGTTEQNKTNQVDKEAQKEREISPVERYIRRARESLEKDNLVRARLELRDAMKLEPNNSTCHSLLGMMYLKQGQLTMAKVHIDKASVSNPKDPFVIQAKRELAKVMPKTDEDQSSGFLGGLFGGKKGK